MKSLLSFVFLFASIPALVVVYVWACVAGYTRVHRKGYSPPATVSLLISAALVGHIPLYFLIPNAILDDWPVELTFSIIFWLPVIIAIAVMALVLRVLPRRSGRISGKRRPRLILIALGIALIAFGVFAVVLTFVAGHNMGDAFLLLGLLICLGISAILLGRRAASTKSVEEVISSDPRAPVLYLRPFRQEQFTFIRGKKSQLAPYMSLAKRLFMSSDRNRDPEVNVRFEEYLQAALNKRIGPFVALGNPEDYVPLEGAARTYARDAEWMQHVERLVAGCSCIVAEIGISRNLSWEMNYLRQNGFQQKLFIMTRPQALKSGFIADFFYKLIASAAQIRTITWNEFATTMSGFGYEVGPDPGLGCIFTFDADGKILILKQGAFTPEDYVEPIRDYLVQNPALAPAIVEAPTTAGVEPSDGDTDEASTHRATPSRLKRIAVTAGPTTVVVALILLFIGRTVWKYHSDRARAEALQSLASQTNLRYKQGNLKFVDADLNNTMLIDHGNLNGQVLEAAEGEYAGIHVLLFDYQYDVEERDREGSSTRKVIQSVAAFCCADPKLPPFDLRDYSYWNVLELTHRETAKHIQFAANPDFSKRFILMASDEPAIGHIFSPQLRSYLTGNYPHGNWRLEGVGLWLILYQEDNPVKPAEWKSFLDNTSQTAKGFLQNMSKETPATQTAATSK